MRQVLIASMLSLVLGGCASSPQTRPFYDDLGGQAGIEAIVDDLLWRVAGDDRINHFFANASVVRLRRLLVEQFCQESGGPCVYSGFPMAEVHANRHVTEANFNALVEHLIDAMDARSVPVPTQNRLLARLAPMRTDIIRR